MKKSEEEILLTVIKNLIDSGRDEVIKLAKHDKEFVELCDKKWEFLNSFWIKHKQEFLDAGFQEPVSDTYEGTVDDWNYNPLSSAYNNLIRDINWIKAEEWKEHRRMSGREKMYLIDGKETTAPVSFKELAVHSGLSLSSVKTSLNRLEGNKIINRSMFNRTPPYYY